MSLEHSSLKWKVRPTKEWVGIASRDIQSPGLCDNMCVTFELLFRNGGCGMGFVRSWLLPAVALFALAGVAAAQTTNGTISGHVEDILGGVLPGVTVTATSPNLQGVRSAVTSGNGDYAIPLLPSGAYTISFELSGFQRFTRTETLAPTQVLPIDARMGPAEVVEDRRRLRRPCKRADRRRLRSRPASISARSRCCRPTGTSTLRFSWRQAFIPQVQTAPTPSQAPHRSNPCSW